MNKNRLTTGRLRIASAVCAALMALGFAGGAANADDTERAKAEFQSTYASVLDAVAKAKARYTASFEAEEKAKQRDRLIGKTREEIDSDIKTAKIELRTANADLEKLHDDARRAGVPPGWLREVEERQAGER